MAPTVPQQTPQELAQVLYDIKLQIEASSLQLKASTEQYQNMIQSVDTLLLNQAMPILNLMWAQHVS